MPITVEYGPDAKLLGLAALMAGKGQKSARDEELAIQLAERERNRKAELARAIIGSFRGGGGGRGGGGPVRNRGREREHELELTRIAAEAQPEARGVGGGGGMTRQQLLEQALIEQGLTPTQLLQAQRAERMGQDLEAEREYQTYLREKKLIDRAPNLTDAEKLEAHRIHELQYAGIQKPGDVLDQGTEFPPGQGIGETWTDGQGNTFTRDASGIPKVLTKGTGQAVDVDKLYQQAVNELGEDADPDAIEKRIVEIHQRNQRIRQRLTQGEPTPAPGSKASYGFAAVPGEAPAARTPDDLIAMGTAQPAGSETVAKTAPAEVPIDKPDYAAIEAAMAPEALRRIEVLTAGLREAKAAGDHQGVMAYKKLLDEQLVQAGVL